MFLYSVKCFGISIDKIYICIRVLRETLRSLRRGAGVVTEQIANLSTGNRRQGSSPCLSAIF